MNKVPFDLKFLQQTLRRDQSLRREKAPRHCGICSVAYMCNYDIDAFCFWSKEYEEQNIVEEELEK